MAAAVARAFGGADARRGLEAVHHRHADVEQDEIGEALAREAQARSDGLERCADDVGGLGDRVTRVEMERHHGTLLGR